MDFYQFNKIKLIKNCVPEPENRQTAWHHCSYWVFWLVCSTATATAESFQLSLSDYSPQCLIKSVNKEKYLFFLFLRPPGLLPRLWATTQRLECICFSPYELWNQLAPLFMNYYWSACLHRIVARTNAFNTVTSHNIVLFILVRICFM